MFHWRWMAALVVTVLASMPPVSLSQDWTSVSGTATSTEGGAPAESDNEPRNGAQRYQMRDKLVSFGDDFWIENDRGERVFKVNGIPTSWRPIFSLADTRRPKRP